MKTKTGILLTFLIFLSSNFAFSSDHNKIFMEGWEYYKQDDYKQAEKIFRKALPLLFSDAEKEDETALFRLGWMYENGVVFKADNEEAAYWYQKGAQLGDASSQYMLGMMYEDGEGVEKSLEKAIYWFKKAAEQGDEFADKALKRIEKSQ